MRDHTLEFLLQFNGVRYVYPNGCWWLIRARRARANRSRPAGIKYSLAFFDADSNCLVRFDNSHSIRGGAPADHWHRVGRDEPLRYSFSGAERLIEDFFAAIDRFLPPELQAGTKSR